MKLNLSIPIALLSFIVVLLSTASTAAQSPLKVRAAYGAMSAAMAPLWYAQDTRLFQKFGIEVELLYIQGNRSLCPPS